jgi:hypothetical protein
LSIPGTKRGRRLFAEALEELAGADRLPGSLRRQHAHEVLGVAVLVTLAVRDTVPQQPELRVFEHRRRLSTSKQQAPWCTCCSGR